MAALVSRVTARPRALLSRTVNLGTCLTGIRTPTRRWFSVTAPTSRECAHIVVRVGLRASCLSKSPSQGSLSYSSLSITASALPLRTWSFDEVKQQVEALEGSNASNLGTIVLVDSREPEELHESGKIPGAVNVPWNTSPQSFDISGDDFDQLHGFVRPPQDATLVFYCKAGIRAQLAAQAAHRAGWNSVGVYDGSWLDWEAQQGPVEPVPRKNGQS